MDSFQPRSGIGSLFDWALDLCGHETFTVQFVATVVIVNLGYIIGNLIYVTLDYFDPAWVQKYRVQVGESKKVTWNKWKHALTLIAVNMLVVLPAMTYAYYRIGRIDISRELPSFGTGLLHVFFFLFADDITFYYAHRFILHHPRLYKHIHKIHHDFQAPFSITAVYAHPLEHVLSLVHVFIGPAILGSHIMVVWIWLTVAHWASITQHSGYHLPFFASPEHHDWHHKVFNENFGALKFLDMLHGTSKQFAATGRNHRHTMLLSLKPAREVYPIKKGKDD